MTCKKYSFFCVSPQLFFPTSPTFNYTPMPIRASNCRSLPTGERDRAARRDRVSLPDSTRLPPPSDCLAPAPSAPRGAATGKGDSRFLCSLNGFIARCRLLIELPCPFRGTRLSAAADAMILKTGYPRDVECLDAGPPSPQSLATFPFTSSHAVFATVVCWAISCYHDSFDCIVIQKFRLNRRCRSLPYILVPMIVGPLLRVSFITALELAWRAWDRRTS